MIPKPLLRRFLGGDVLIAGDTLVEERVWPERTAPMTRLCQTVGGFYALGAAGFFFRRSDAGEWSVLSKSYFQPDSPTKGILDKLMEIGGYQSEEEYWDDKSIAQQTRLHTELGRREAPYYAIGGFAPDDLYLAGQNGAMLHFDGTDMHRIESGAKSTLTNVIARNGDIYVAGAHRGAVILKGNRATGFTPIFEAPVKQLWLDSMAFNGDDILIGDPEPATGGLYRLDPGGRLHKLPEIAAPIWKVDVVDGVIWALEAKAINRFEGGSWERYDSPSG